MISKIFNFWFKNDGTQCVRIGYSYGECLCKKCIELDKQRENNGYIPKFGEI